MERIKKILLSLVTIVSVTILVKSFILPQIWWMYLVAIFLLGILFRKKLRHAFFTGLLSGAVAFFILLVIASNEAIDLTRISTFLFGTVIVTKLVTCFVGALLTALAFHAGKHFPLTKSA